MTPWQRRARLGAGVVAVTVAGAAYWVTGSRRVATTAPPITPLAEQVISQVTKGEAAQTTRDREEFSLDFEKQVTYKDGRTVASGLTVRVPNRGGRSFTVSAK